MKELMTKSFCIRIAILMATMTAIISHLYFREVVAKDNISWIFWLVAMVMLVWAGKERDNDSDDFVSIGKTEWKKLLLLLGGLTVLFFIVRYMNAPISPWNANGFYDDAAWDVYYMRKHVDEAVSVQVIMYDDFVIGNVRELLFAWYLLPFFRLLGYNANVLNFACVVLGGIGMIFTTLTARRLFKSDKMALLAGILITVNPFHFAHTYMAERYAIVPTLLVISTYYITCALQDKSTYKAALGGIFAALCAGGGKTGKTYMYGLVAAAILYIIFNIKDIIKIRSFKEIRKKYYLLGWFLGGFLIGFAPYIAFIAAFPEVYDSRESALLTDFFVQLRENGLAYLLPLIINPFRMVFRANAQGKQYTAGYPLISLWHAGLFFIGTGFAFVRKRYDIFVMCLLPAAALILVPPYDYRLYISTPLWILAVVFTIDAVLKIKKDNLRKALVLTAFTCLSMGVITGMVYLSKMTSNPNSQYLNQRLDVGIGRMMQDIIIDGEGEPSVYIKKDEFKRKNIPEDSGKNHLVAMETASGVGELYLIDIPRESLQYLNGRQINFGFEEPEVNAANVKAVLNTFDDYGKDLQILIQEGINIGPVLDAIKAAESYGTATSYNQQLDGIDIRMYRIDIPRENVEQFKNAVLSGL